MKSGNFRCHCPVRKFKSVQLMIDFNSYINSGKSTDEGPVNFNVQLNMPEKYIVSIPCTIAICVFKFIDV